MNKETYEKLVKIRALLWDGCDNALIENAIEELDEIIKETYETQTESVSAMSSGGLRDRIYQTTRSLRAGQDARITYTPAITYSEC